MIGVSVAVSCAPQAASVSTDAEMSSRFIFVFPRQRLLLVMIWHERYQSARKGFTRNLAPESRGKGNPLILISRNRRKSCRAPSLYCSCPVRSGRGYLFGVARDEIPVYLSRRFHWCAAADNCFCAKSHNNRHIHIRFKHSHTANAYNRITDFGFARHYIEGALQSEIARQDNFGFGRCFESDVNDRLWKRNG